MQYIEPAHMLQLIIYDEIELFNPEDSKVRHSKLTKIWGRENLQLLNHCPKFKWQSKQPETAAAHQICAG
jgi:hypothetical protein